MTSTQSRVRFKPSALDSANGWATTATSSSRPESRIGELYGSYRIRELIGAGGMGCVYRAEHARIGRTVALKVLHEHHARHREASLRLFQEARASSHIHHKNIVDVVDYLELEGGVVCIVMEHLAGPSLARMMATRGALPPARALDLLAQIADGLDAAHAAGFVHRDLKPENILVVAAPDGSGGDLVKLLDFGVAKLMDDDEDAPQTAAGQVMGTPAYMSPEQATGAAVDARTDIYALGAIMYELFTGEMPFVARTFDEYVFKHLTVAPAPPRETAGGRELDPRIEEVILRCLEKDPAGRYGSARELGAELLAIRDALSATEDPAATPAPVPAFEWLGAAAARPAVKRSVWTALAVAAAALLGFSAARAVHSTGDAPAASPARASAAGEPEGPALVRIVSDPPGRVYPGGRDEPMCRTPCAIAIPPRSGRSARPVYTVRRRGYRDEAIAVDPEAPPSQVQIRLERERSRPRRDRP
ncbi:MAG TPA: serine/threonine-protein kinase [Kofleriaceae bacterium]|jgi:serine/threonine-protein kinase